MSDFTLDDFTLDDIRRAVREEVRAELAEFGLKAQSKDGLLTIEEVCEYLSISKTTLWELRRKGEITGHTVGRRVLFREADVEALVGGDGRDAPVPI